MADRDRIARIVREVAGRYPSAASAEAPVTIDMSDLGVRQTHDAVIIPHHDTVIEAEDHVIVFCSSKKLVSRVERLFQVGFGFL